MMRKVITSILVALLGAACTGNPVAPPPPSAPEAPPPLPAAPKAVLSVGRGDSTPPFAVVNVTQLLFDASRSEGDGLTYLVEYGDGASSTEPVTTHRVNGSPPIAPRKQRTAKLTVTDRHGRTDSTTQPYFLVSVHTGIGYGAFWHGDPDGDGPYLNMALAEDRATLSGVYWGWDSRRTFHGSLTGVLTDDRAIRLKTEDGAIEFSGTVELRPRPDFGPGGWPDVILRLSMKGGPLNGSVVEFEFADPY